MVNVVVGWVALIIAGVSAYFADFPAHPLQGAISAAVGFLAVHARNWRANPWTKRATALEQN